MTDFWVGLVVVVSWAFWWLSFLTLIIGVAGLLICAVWWVIFGIQRLVRAAGGGEVFESDDPLVTVGVTLQWVVLAGIAAMSASTAQAYVPLVNQLTRATDADPLHSHHILTLWADTNASVIVTAAGMAVVLLLVIVLLRRPGRYSRRRIGGAPVLTAAKPHRTQQDRAARPLTGVPMVTPPLTEEEIAWAVAAEGNNPVDRRRTAVHEAGHLLAGWLQPDFYWRFIHAEVPQVDPSTTLGGHVQTFPGGVAGFSRTQAVFTHVVMALGGRAAELVVFNQTTAGGATGDTEKARELVGMMRNSWAALTLPGHTRPVRLETTSVDQVIAAAADHAHQLLLGHTAALETVAAALLDAGDDGIDRYHLTGLRRQLFPDLTTPAPHTDPSGITPAAEGALR